MFVERSQNAHAVITQETLLPVLKWTAHNSGQTDINEYLQDAEGMRTEKIAREPDKPHTKAWVTFIHHTYFYPLASVRSFEHVQNMLTERTDIT